MEKAVIHKTPAPSGANGTQSNFIKSAFDTLIWNKGYRVTIEECLRCPCKGKGTNQQSDCRNCGGTGYVFINKRETRAVIHSQNMNTKFKEWSEENASQASATFMQEEEVSFMDRITVLDTNAIQEQVLFLIEQVNGNDESRSSSESESQSTLIKDSAFYFASTYDIKEIKYIGIYNGSQNPIVPLVYGTDFTYKGNRIILSTATARKYIDTAKEGNQDVSITLRYMYAVQYHVIDLPRETIQTNTKFGEIDEGKTGVNLPIHAQLRRSHYVLDEPNFDYNRLNDNNHKFKYSEVNPPKSKC
jgi:hypothetical protein